MVTLAANAALSGRFTLIYPGLGSTEPLAHDTSPEVFASSIRAFQGEPVSVSRSRTGVRGYTWSITFDDLSGGDRPQLVAIANDSLETRAADGTFILNANTVTDGVAAIGGTFEITYRSEDGRAVAAQTGPISHDASAHEVQAALEALSGVGDVVVTVELLNGGESGRIFTMSWPAERGNVPLLHVNGSGLTPTTDDVGIPGAAMAYINEVSGECCFLKAETSHHDHRFNV